ncbi:hypothetical protein HanIR_Chr08g0356791 [Helianthus annuus]|nr:hypothetical protein HanIR_Chr08g0356791 [Helianthus annuus]
MNNPLELRQIGFKVHCSNLFSLIFINTYLNLSLTYSNLCPNAYNLSYGWLGLKTRLRHVKSEV